MDYLELRGHHLIGAKLISKLSRQKFAKLLQKEGYIDSQNSNYLDKVYNHLKEFLASPTNKIKLIIGGLDFICENCPESKKRKCNSNNPTTTFKAFTEHDYEGELSDAQILESYNLKPNQVYTVEEIQRRMNF